MADKPIYHGRDHRPGGPDPIPGIGAGFTPASCQAVATGLGTIGPGTVAVTWPSILTTSSSAFNLNSGDATKIEVQEPGIYLLSGGFQTVTQPTSFTSTCYMYADVQDQTNASVGTLHGSFWRFDDATAADPKEVTEMHGADYSNIAAGFSFPVEVRVFFQLGQAVNIGAATLNLTQITPTGF